MGPIREEEVKWINSKIPVRSINRHFSQLKFNLLRDWANESLWPGLFVAFLWVDDSTGIFLNFDWSTISWNKLAIEREEQYTLSHLTQTRLRYLDLSVYTIATGTILRLSSSGLRFSARDCSCTHFRYSTPTQPAPGRTCTIPGWV